MIRDRVAPEDLFIVITHTSNVVSLIETLIAKIKIIVINVVDNLVRFIMCIVCLALSLYVVSVREEQQNRVMQKDL